MEMMADNFPGAFASYTLRVTESHQSTKKDTSGTAKAIVASFQRLGLDFDVNQIELVRKREAQVDCCMSGTGRRQLFLSVAWMPPTLGWCALA